MAAQTPVQVSLLSKLLGYFDLAAKVGEVVPIAHVTAISTLVDSLLQEIMAISAAKQTATIASPVPAQVLTPTISPVMVIWNGRGPMPADMVEGPNTTQRPFGGYLNVKTGLPYYNDPVSLAAALNANYAAIGSGDRATAEGVKARYFV